MKAYYVKRNGSFVLEKRSHAPKNEEHYLAIPDGAGGFEDPRWIEIQEVEVEIISAGIDEEGNEVAAVTEPRMIPVVNESTKSSVEALDVTVQVDRQWALLRAERDRKLVDSDWTQLADCPLDATAKSNWATYRQELRDLPANTADPASPTWPSKPS